MKVTVKYFGMIAELAGKTEELLEVPSGTSAIELKDRQVRRYQIQDPESVQLAVNQNLDNKVELNEGDEVAFLPPFAGG
ncbi:molybdopterin synthase sulfur carrier subunit [Christiangramia gaetbulicola]|uniref:Molybdopterin synthase sulfur carrier subunit n=1 Tax=Christiangramia gaetbulicola TaxID=703340 RepID=A0A2T6ACC9_9FLAO|nr:MoaD/ThiS family protein [Christiangramia gaetbulicola]PTX41465.1 molybdopterin synthase sulfur carrier subunit [Christiangramia gaetbulicola]